ncbi:hypothetical protein GCM10027168_19750 [Streptomyces capparidis]
MPGVAGRTGIDARPQRLSGESCDWRATGSFRLVWGGRWKCRRKVINGFLFRQRTGIPLAGSADALTRFGSTVTLAAIRLWLRS